MLTHLRDRFYHVALPEGAKDVKVLPSSLHLYFIPPGDKQKYHQAINLPSGTWKLLFLEPTGEQAAEVVSRFHYLTETWRNYLSPSPPPYFDTALESYQSLLKSKHLKAGAVIELTSK